MNLNSQKKTAIILSALAAFPATASLAQAPSKEASAQQPLKTTAQKPANSSVPRVTMTPQQQKAVASSVNSLREAVKLTQTRKWPQAYAAYSKLIKANPELGMAYGDRAVSLIALRRYKEAVSDCNKAISLGKDSADVYNRRAVAYMQMKKYDLALADYTKVINLQPTSAAAYRDRAVCYLRKGDKKNAQRDIAMTKKALGGKLADTKQNQKQSFLAVKDASIVDLSSVSTQKFDELIKKDPDHKPMYMLQRATVNMFQAKPQKALEDIDQVLKLNDEQLKKGGCPTRSAILKLRVTALQKLGKFSEALADCNTVLAAVPGDEQARLVKAMSEYELGKYKEAIDDAAKIKSNQKLVNAAKILSSKARAKLAPEKKGTRSK